VLVVVGDFDAAQTKSWITRYYAQIPGRARPSLPDVTEPRQTSEKHASHTDPLAPLPALAIGYHVPLRWTPEYFAFGLIDQMLVQGEASRLYRSLVQRHGYSETVDGGINSVLAVCLTTAGLCCGRRH